MTRMVFLVSLALAGTVVAQDQPIRIGVLNDQTSVYADFQGRGSVLAAQMAVEDYGAKAAGRRIDVVFADHQNKPDVGSVVARKWLDQDGVDLIVDIPNSAVALAVNEIVRQKNKVLIGSGAGSAELTGSKCSPNTVHWTYDTWSYGHSLAKAVVQRGGMTWFFITADYAFGHDLERQATDQLLKDGGKVLGGVRVPIATPDFSSFLLAAQSSGAQVVALAVAGGAGDGKAVVAAMKAMTTDDPLFGKGRIREDGRKLHPMYLLQVKAPEESKSDWDYFKVLASIPAEQAFRPLNEGNCPFVAGK